MSTTSNDEIRNFSGLENLYNMTSGVETEFSPEEVCPDLEPQELDDWVEDMEMRGLIKDEGSMPKLISLSRDGRQFVQKGISKREDTVKFRSVVRQRLLKWTDQRSKSSDDKYTVELDDNESWFFGRWISGDDLVRAAEELAIKGFIRQKKLEVWDPDTPPIILVSITAKGQECAEDYDSKIEKYAKAKEKLMSNPQINIGSVNGGNVSVGNGNKLVSTVGVVNTQQIAKFASTFRRMLPELELDESQRHEAEQYAVDLENAEDPSKVRRALEWIKNLAVSATSDGLAELLAGKANELLQALQG